MQETWLTDEEIKAHKAALNRMRQRKYRERQALLKRKPVTLMLTDDERFFLERTLEAMRKGGGVTPALGRDPKTGRFVPIDV